MRTIAFWLSLLVIFIIPWDYAIKFEGMGTLIKLTGFILTGVWIMAVVSTGKFRQLRPFHLVVFIFIFWNFVSLFWSPNTGRTMIRVLTYTQLVVMMLILWDIYTTPSHLKAGLQVFILGYFVTINATISKFLVGDKNEWGYVWERYSAFNVNPNTLALMMAIGIPIAWYLAVSQGDGKRAYVLKIINFAFVPLSLFTIMLTSSRGGLIAVIPAFFYILGSITRLSLFRRLLITAILVGVLYALYPLVPQSSLDRLATTETEISEGTLSNRTIIWEEGIKVFFKHPIIGVGSNAFYDTVKFQNRNITAHNTYLEVAVEVGLIGFALFVIMIVMTVRHAIHQPKVHATMWLTVILIWAIGVYGLSWQTTKTTWLIMSLVLVSTALFGQSQETGKQSNLLSEPSILPDPSFATVDQ